MMKRNLLLLLLMMGTILLVPACARIVAASPDQSGEIEIVLSDYKFEPDVIRLKAGQTVHIKLRNEVHKMHEFMAGRDVQIHGNFTEGFGEDFFAGISPQISGPGMVMGGPEGMDMGGEDMAMGEDDDHAEDDMDMGEDDDHAEDDMDMSEDDHSADDDHVEDDMAMSDGEAGHEEGQEDEHEEEGVAGAFGALQMPEMDAHAGLMVMIDPQMIPAGEVTTITFTVPEDKVGRWQIGCFQERGQHYDDGMDGVIIVEP